MKFSKKRQPCIQRSRFPLSTTIDITEDHVTFSNGFRYFNGVKRGFCFFSRYEDTLNYYTPNIGAFSIRVIFFFLLCHDRFDARLG